MHNNSEINKVAKIDKPIFILSSIALLFLIFASFVFSAETIKFLQKSLHIFGESTGIFYMVGNLIMLFLCLYFSCSKWGSLKFGEPGEKPDFSLFSWGAMMFCTSLGGACLYWASMEPLMHLKEVPFSWIEPMSEESYTWSMTFMLFRPWLIWGWYVIPTLPICYLLYIKKGEIMRFSELLSPVLGKRFASGPFLLFIEVSFVLSVILCYAGVFAVSTPLCSACLAAVFGLKHTFWLDVFVVAACTVMFMWSTYVGLKKGIRFLSELNIYIALGFVIFIIIAGPTMFLLNNTAFSFGNLVDNFFLLSLGKEPFQETTFATDWTQFIILWQISAAPLMALFTARISRGRTVRELIAGTFISGILGQYLLFGSFGGFALYIQHEGIVDLVSIMETEGKGAALVALFSQLPFKEVVLFVCMIFMTIFTATCIDSTAFVLASSCSTNMLECQEPSRINKFYWAIVQGVIAIAFIFMGALTATKVLGSYSGVIMLFPVIVSVFTWFKYCNEYYHENKDPEKKLTF